jgi:hypothetical protein
VPLEKNDKTARFRRVLYTGIYNEERLLPHLARKTSHPVEVRNPMRI